MKPAHTTFEKALAPDIAFHLAIAKATQNPLIVSFMQFLQPYLYESIALARANSARRSGVEIIAYEDHHAIYEAIVHLILRAPGGPGACSNEACGDFRRPGRPARPPPPSTAPVIAKKARP